MYAEINPTINYNKALPQNTVHTDKNFGTGYNGNNNSQYSQYEETPNFSKFQDLHGQNKKFSENYCGGGSTLAVEKGLKLENSDVSLLFFSDNNVRRIQSQIKGEVYRLSNGIFKLEVDQDESDLLLAMRYIFIEFGQNLPTHIVRQVKLLNKHLIEYIIPDIMTNIKQHYAYLKEISSPIKPMEQPLNVNSKGRRSLPSITTLWR